MRAPNIRAIRENLPHGSLTRISNETGFTVKVISEFFNQGWHSDKAVPILNSAVGIIKDIYPDEALMEQIEELGFTGSYSPVQTKPKKKPTRSDDSQGAMGWLLGIAGVVAGAYFMIPEVKDFIDEKIFGKEPDIVEKSIRKEVENIKKGK